MLGQRVGWIIGCANDGDLVGGEDSVCGQIVRLKARIGLFLGQFAAGDLLLQCICRTFGHITGQAVEADVRARTPYGRVFVCGYVGLAVLHDQPRGRLLPNLDLHVGELRRLYYGQTLFILVHRPIGRAAADSVHWRFPDSYRLGLERTLYARDFGEEWRLFKVVGAPTEEQLRAWRK